MAIAVAFAVATATVASPSGAEVTVEESSVAEPDVTERPISQAYEVNASGFVDLELAERVGDVFVDLDGERGRVLKENDNTVLYEEFRAVSGEAFADQLVGLGERDIPGFVFSAGSFETAIQLVPAKEIQLGQDGIVVMRSVETGEYFISSVGETTTGFYAEFTDPLLRGYWLIESVTEGLRIRLVKPSPDFAEDDLIHDRDSDPEIEPIEPIEPLEVAPEHRDPDDVPSMMPSADWVDDSGDRLYEDEALREIGRALVGPRNRVTVSNPTMQVIDVAVFSAGVSSNWGSVSSKAQIIVNDANAAMASGGVAVRFRLVASRAGGPGFDPANINQTGSTNKMIEEARGIAHQPSDVDEEVVAMRFDHGADIVVILAPDNSLINGVGVRANGVAARTPGPASDPALETYALAIIEWSDTGGHTPAHEIGHLLGAGHYDNGGNGYSYAESYRFTIFGGDPAQTVMDTAGSVRINRFSDKNGTYVGFPVGTSSRDNVRAINIFRNTVDDWQPGAYCSSDGVDRYLFVVGTYTSLTGVAPTTASRNAYRNRLVQGYFNINGGGSWEVYDAGLAIEDMGTRSGNSEVGYEITRLYRTIFNRVPDLGGHNFWRDQRRNGMSLTTVAANFLAAEAFPANLSNTGYVNHMYNTAHGVPPTTAQRNSWVNWLQNTPGASRELMASFMANTAEARAHLEGDEEVVQLYESLWGQTASSSGVAAYANLIENSGWTQADVARIFLRDTKYTNGCVS